MSNAEPQSQITSRVRKKEITGDCGRSKEAVNSSFSCSSQPALASSPHFDLSNLFRILPVGLLGETLGIHKRSLLRCCNSSGREAEHYTHILKRACFFHQLQLIPTALVHHLLHRKQQISTMQLKQDIARKWTGKSHLQNSRAFEGCPLRIAVQTAAASDTFPRRAGRCCRTSRLRHPRSPSAPPVAVGPAPSSALAKGGEQFWSERKEGK
jgi:hypothetical protein